ncbi:hypothetical protein HRI96_08475 [Treponema parvum]|uniref:Lipopolysaccharide assembly protein A domain-containing protein n=1 Tax=Treponema parvum TaxID=138851 RepID=A0A975F0R2_9SPIR|nr:hypothetical protein [Treponema parvum]QTQ12228.1 hypothetical protein HRI96_08475 [Treponema parvum]
MPLKLVGTVILLVLVTIFAGFNIDNKCNVNLIFRQFSDVPIFFSLMVAFVSGVILMIPFTIGKRRRAENNAGKRKVKEKIAEKNAKNLKKQNEASETEPSAIQNQADF